MRILYCGKLEVGSTSLSRFQAIAELGHHVIPIDTSNYIPKNKFLRGLQSRQIFNLSVNKLNKELLRRAILSKPEILWVDKGTLIKHETLNMIKSQMSIKLLHHNTDDIFNHKHGFKNYFDSLNLYDFHVTSNRHNVNELKKLCDNRIIFNDIGYDHNFYNPKKTEINKKFESDIIFIGHWEPDYEKYLKELFGIYNFKIHGPGWKDKIPSKFSHHYISDGVWGEDYVNWLRGAKIGIGLVSSLNRNDTSGRVFEIPATGTFMIARRNKILENMYNENDEVAFFDSNDNLRIKVDYYLKNEDLREKIAQNGMKRCTLNKCSWHDRVVEIFDEIKKNNLQ